MIVIIIVPIFGFLQAPATARRIIIYCDYYLLL